jgi:rSAM/selenodomain-associated transferase 2
MNKKNHVSIIIPVLNEGQYLKCLLESIQCWRHEGHEIILVDGGSDNKNNVSLEFLVDKKLKAPPGRALQMNEGSRHAQHEILFFLHADSNLAGNSISAIIQGLQKSKNVWGRFNIKLSGSHWMLRIIEKMMNIRSRVTGIATGDQGIFVYRKVFNQINGYANIELMEDIEISKRLKKISQPVCLTSQITTSSRKWEQKGIVKTMVLMWFLRLAFFIGVSPRRLSSIYYSS